jgi:hypothetical protein
MPSPLNVGDILQIALISRRDVQYSANVRQFRVSAVGGVPATDADALVELDAVFAPLLKPLIATNGSYHGLKGSRISPMPTPTLAAFAGRGAGTAAGDAMAPQVAGILRLLTGLAGRSKRGRMYVPFPSETDNGPDGRPEAGYFARMTSLGDALDGGILVAVGGRTATLTPIIYHRATNTYDDITFYAVVGNWGTQRRRSFVNRPDSDPLDGVPPA